jgi:predicted nucleic acid-binding protein
MSVRSFFDTNVLVYVEDHGSPAKQVRARDTLERTRRAGETVLSTQVLQEYFVTVTRKLRVSPQIARTKVQILARCDVVRTDVEDIVAAIDLHHLHGLAFWDALIVRCAIRGGCSVLYTEDLQPGRRFDGVEVVNPFA